MSRPANRRYPGTRSFDDTPDDRRLFTGRGMEIRDLCQRIASHRVMVLYAPSGTGKSSLLRAGVFPDLRAAGYLPLDLRFIHNPKLKLAEQKDLRLQLRDEAERECSRPGQNADAVDAPNTPCSFLHFFQATEFWGPDGPMTPVLVLDQFEEVFRWKDPHFRIALLGELAHLLRGGDSGPDTPASTPGGAARVARLRLVISLREEAVGELAALGAGVPGLMDHAYRLPPLRDETAKIAITEPAGKDMQGDYTPPFACDAAAVNELVAWLAEQTGASAYEDLSGTVSNTVESFMLQVFCEHIEESVLRQREQTGASAGFTTALFADPAKRDLVLRKFYFRKLAEYLDSAAGAAQSGRRRATETIQPLFEADSAAQPTVRESGAASRAGGHLARSFRTPLRYAAGARFLARVISSRRGRRVLKLLEEDLLTSDGRRKPCDRMDAINVRKLTEDDLAALVAARLVRTERHGGSDVLSLTHDKLAATIHKSSIRRAFRQLVYTYFWAGVAAVVILLSRWWISQEREKADTAQSVAVEAQKGKKAASERADEEQRQKQEEQRKKREFEKMAGDLNAARQKTALVAAERAAVAESPHQAVDWLAQAVESDPANDAIFRQLVGKSASVGPVLPDGLWLPPSGTRVLAASPEGLHFALHFPAPDERIEIRHAARPGEAGLPVAVPAETRSARFSLGAGGKVLLALVAGRGQPGEQYSVKQSAPPKAAETAVHTFNLLRPGQTINVLSGVESLPSTITALQVSPEGRWLALTDDTEGVHLVDLRQSKLRELAFPAVAPAAANRRPAGTNIPASAPARTRFLAVAFHPKDQTAAIVSGDRKCHIYDTAGDKFVTVGAGTCTGAVFSPDGNWIACSGSAALKLRRSDDWNPGTGDWSDATWSELAPEPHPRTGGAFSRVASFSPESTKIYLSRPVAYPGTTRRDQRDISGQRYIYTTDWHLFTAPFTSEAPSTAVQPVASPLRRALSITEPAALRAHMEQIAVQPYTAPQIDSSGRWIMEGAHGKGQFALRDLTQTTDPEKLPFVLAENLKPSGIAAATADAAGTRWISFAAADTPGAEKFPAVHRVTGDAEFSLWKFHPVRWLRPQWLEPPLPRDAGEALVRSTSRFATLPREGESILMQAIEGKETRVWTVGLNGVTAGPRQMKLPPEWQAVSLSSGRWLTATGTVKNGDREESRVGVWDLDTGSLTASFPPPQGFELPSDAEVAAGLSSDSRLLACVFANSNSGDTLTVHTIPLASAADRPAWTSGCTGRGLISFERGLCFHRDGTGSLVARNLWQPAAPAVPLLKAEELPGEPVLCLHPGGTRLLAAWMQNGNTRAVSLRREGAAWSIESGWPRMLEGGGPFARAAISDDWTWLAVWSGGTLFTWRLHDSGAVPLPPLASGEDPPALRFLPGAATLAIGTGGRIARFQPADWQFTASEKGRRAFAKLAASIAAPEKLKESMRSDTGGEGGYRSPSEFLWQQFTAELPPEEVKLRQLAAWLLGRPDSQGLTPFSPAGDTLEKWAASARESGSPADALEINPADPEALALSAASNATDLRLSTGYGAIMAGFFHAKRNATPDSAPRIAKLQSEALDMVANVLLSVSNEPARAAAAIKAGGLTDPVLLEKLRKAEDAAKRATALPLPHAMAE